MLNKIKNLKNIFIDVEGATIPVSETSHKLNQSAPKMIRSSRSIADIGRGRFRRMFDRHKLAYGY